ncbi:MAG: IS1634 family transposase, partial [Thermoleophilaceae bacterium]
MRGRGFSWAVRALAARGSRRGGAVDGEAARAPAPARPCSLEGARLGRRDGRAAAAVAGLESRHRPRARALDAGVRARRRGLRRGRALRGARLAAGPPGEIEDRLARRHLVDGELVLYDVSSSYFEGRRCALARLGYSRDERRGTPQIIYGLLCDKPGRPLSVEVFSGELSDDKTLPAQIEKLKRRFGLETVVVVSDRGMVTKANLELLRADGDAAWITALKAPQVKKLVTDGALQLSLFDEHNLAEIAADDYPDERLIVCRNPLVGAERSRKREDLLSATERGLSEIAERVERGTLRGSDRIGLAVGPALTRHRVGKHFEIEITDTGFTFSRKTEQIKAEADLDGFYVLRTSAGEDELSAAEVVRSYKGLEQVER